jgi:hypothetical protein
MGDTQKYYSVKKATQHHCTLKGLGELNSGLSNAPFELKMFYINGLNVPITVVLRNGIKFTIPPTVGVKENDFIIEQQYIYHDEVILDANNLLNDTSSDSHLLKNIMEEETQTYIRGQKSKKVRFSFTKDDITNKGGNLYLYNLDLTVSIWNDSHVSLHPFSESGLRNLFLEKTEDVNTYRSFGYSIRVIDNDGEFGTKFININNKVYKIIPIKDSFYKNGVYFISSGSVTGDNSEPLPLSDFYSYEDAIEKLGLFDSFVQANTLGNVLATRKKELEDYAFVIKEKENNLKKQKLEMDSEFENRKRRLEAIRLQEEEDKRLREIKYKKEEMALIQKQTLLKDQIAELEHTRSISSMNRKDHYEEKSYSRKDSSEAIKFVPLVVGGLIAIAAVIFKK